MCGYIKRHRCPINYHGSKGASFSKLKIKMMLKSPTSIRQRSILILEGVYQMIDKASSVYFQNKGYWPSDYCNYTGITTNANKSQT